MKKVLILTALLALVATSSFAAIANTKHDLSSGSSATLKGTSNEICVYCHTPHGAAAVGTAPLWNRGAAVAATDFYNNPAGTMDATVSLALTNATDAGLCLSCHDGSAITQALTNPPNTGIAAFSINVGAAANLDTDLSNDHPIGFDYSAALVTADGELQSKANVQAVAGMTDALSYGGGNDMWCSSCHDVHGVAGVSTFLRMANTGSALCTTCHVK